MRRSWAALTVGILTVAVFVVGYAGFRYIKERIGKDEGIMVFARFTDAIGLNTKSPVRSAGIDIGQIEGISLEPETGKAKVEIRIDTEKVPHIYNDAWVFKRSASLLGEYYLEIEPGKPFEVKNGQRAEHRELKDGDEIVNVFEGKSTQDIVNQVADIMPIMKEILQDVRSLTSGQVKQIADNVNEMVAKNSVVLERLLLRIDGIAASVEGITREESENIKVTIQNVREITEGVKALVGKSEGEVSKTGEQLRNSIDKLQNSITKLEKSMTNVEQITDKVNDGKGTVGHLINDPDIAENVEQITKDAGTFVRGITRLQTIVGLRSEYNYIAGTFKTYFQVQLAPRPDKFYLIEVIDDPRGFREQEQTIIESSARGVEHETKVRTSEKLRLSFMFGKRWGPLVGRFGIKESTGGVGLDLYFLGDRLMLSTDIFDARSNQYPRTTARAYLAVYKRYLYLVGGIDDLLNYTPSRSGAGGFFDWFFGAQLQFNDEDLKSLLLVGGGSVAGAAR